MSAKRIFQTLFALLLATAAQATTLNPIQLLNPTGSTSGQAIVSTGASTPPAWGGVGVNGIAAIAANTVLANATGSSASPTAFAMPSCSTTISALNWTSGTGFTCGGSGLAPLASPTFTGTVTVANLTASGTITGIAGRLLNVQVFTATGTYTPTTGTNSIIIELVGGGGGGGGAALTGAAQVAAGSGGQGGAYVKSRITTGFSGQTVTIGAAGTAGTAGANNGGNGGNSTFLTLTASGGNGGIGGPASTAPYFVAPSTTAATATNGTIANVNGQFGTAGQSFAVASGVILGAGGGSPFGLGTVITLTGTTATGASGTGKGSGGGGGANDASQSAVAGGAGTAGYSVIFEYQ